MAVRPASIIAAVVLMLFGGVATYLGMTVPRDVRAEALLKQARTELREGKFEEAQASLQTILQKYPGTDAGAASSQVLFHMLSEDKKTLKTQLARVKSDQRKNLQRVQELERAVAELKRARAESASVKPPPRPTAPKAKPRPKPVIRITPSRKRTKLRKAPVRSRSRRRASIEIHPLSGPPSAVFG